MDNVMTYLTAAMTGLTAALVVITAVYAYLTYRMVKASETSARLMKEQSDALTRPYVSLSLVKPHNDPFIFLRIENTGQTAAQDLTLTLGPEFDNIQHEQLLTNLKNSYLFTKTLSSFPPHSPVCFILGSGHSLLSKDKNTAQLPFSITARYSFIGTAVSETTWLDVNQYDSSALDTDPVVTALDKIKDEIRKMK